MGVWNRGTIPLRGRLETRSGRMAYGSKDRICTNDLGSVKRIYAHLAKPRWLLALFSFC